MNKKIANIILQIFVVVWIFVSLALSLLTLYMGKELSLLIQSLISLIVSIALFVYIRYCCTR